MVEVPAQRALTYVRVPRGRPRTWCSTLWSDRGCACMHTDFDQTPTSQTDHTQVLIDPFVCCVAGWHCTAQAGLGGGGRRRRLCCCCARARARARSVVRTSTTRTTVHGGAQRGRAAPSDAMRCGQGNNGGPRPRTCSMGSVERRGCMGLCLCLDHGWWLFLGAGPVARPAVSVSVSPAARMQSPGLPPSPRWGSCRAPAPMDPPCA